MNNLWRDEEAGEGELEQLVYLSNVIGRDAALVQPGGGNTSVKLEEDDALGCRVTALVVKGSGRQTCVRLGRAGLRTCTRTSWPCCDARRRWTTRG